MRLNNGRSRERAGIQVIARAAKILRALEDEASGLSLGEIASRVSLARSTVQRIVQALLDEQLLMSASNKGRVKLGPALVRLGAAASIEVAQIAHGYMQDLARSLGETVDLSTMKGDAAVFIGQVAGSHRLAAISRVGTVFPLHSTANGKAMLACLPAARRTELISRRLTKDTPATITKAKGLQQQIEEILKTGLAYDREEHTDGICAIGTSFLDAFDRPYALSIPVPKPRYEPNRRTLEKSLLEVRSVLVRKIGGSLPGM
jgi:DNA-binding IclR family transcriptional regulator